MTFDTPESLFQWHLAHWYTDEDDDKDEVGDTRCPWCRCRIYKLYHESGCPVRDLITDHRAKKKIKSDQDHVAFATDDEPEGPDCPRLHVMVAGNLDYYLTVRRGDGKRWPATRHAFRASTSGSRNLLLTFLVACMWKLGRGDLAGAASCARAFADQCDSDAKSEPNSCPGLEPGT